MNSFEKFLFYVLVFSIPFQTRVFLYSPSAGFSGFNEWQSIFVYGTDFLVGILFLYWLPRFLKNINWAFNLSFVLLFIILIFAGLSVYFASYLNIGIYRFVKLLEFIWLFFYTIRAFQPYDFGKAKAKFSDVAVILGLSGMIQGIIAIWQFLTQRSIGLIFLGESPLGPHIEDVAEIVANGARFIRAYGTFPSPNVLAAFLSICILSVLTWYINRPYRLHKHFFFASASLVVMGLALFLTFSRAVIAMFVLVAFFYFLIIFFSGRFEKRFKIAARHIFLVLILAGAVFSVIYAPELHSRFVTNVFDVRDASIVEREFWIKLSWNVLEERPLGVGMGNVTLFFRDMYPGLKNSLYQPVHNVFLLMAIEAGAIAALSFLVLIMILLFQSIKTLVGKKDLRPLCILPPLLLIFFVGTGIFDHYYLTLQQGSLMFWMGLGIIYHINRVETNKQQ